ncbi:hypothetical protein ACFQ14_00180 [Pseudahrensia aquimaris]|uniref:DUF805 domain-containing protein n=1 Tax=Pseudahrensia aquimaris TaxID=744461 RepID=A0ABW3FDC7_9HYPH
MNHFDTFGFGYGHGFGLSYGLLWMLLLSVIIIVPIWRIVSRAGLHPLLSLLILIPFVNLLFLYYLAFAPWKRSSDQSAAI